MFEIESKNPDEISIVTKKATIKFNIADAVIDAGLSVGKITGVLLKEILGFQMAGSREG